MIEVVASLRSQGLEVNMIINGDKPEDLDLTYSWVQFHGKQPLQSLAELLRSADVGLIPYTDREYWGLVSITKMSMYMAAGLPILCLRLTETSNILAKWECGLSADDWSGFKATIETLYRNKSLREKLGCNARRAAVQEYNWEIQSERLGSFITTIIRSSSQVKVSL